MFQHLQSYVGNDRGYNICVQVEQLQVMTILTVSRTLVEEPIEVVHDLQKLGLKQAREKFDHSGRSSAKPMRAVAQSITRTTAGGHMWVRGAAAAVEVHKRPGLVEYEVRLALGMESQCVFENVNHILSTAVKFARVLLGEGDKHIAVSWWFEVWEWWVVWRWVKL
ncbi:hypothetical protein BDQ17DRAFT_1408742 [Cyathus striatus]|nr:hypothetical protein BDQ17DRAFT_1408742 [Cyathus striatus]